MHFKRLSLSGFKSFVDSTDLLIEPGLTGIVGPNGCGKSNIVEGLRWVMGESSARGLRGDEMDDVIFKGAAGRPAFDMAEVVLHAQRVSPEGAGALEDLAIARRINRASGSVYRINGREVRARDVQVLFADAQSGARSAAIVGQGQIGAIVEAKGHERRRLLEEAAGIAGLHVRRAEAERRLRAAEDNLIRLEDILKANEQQLSGLKRQAGQARRYRELGEKLRRVEARLLERRYRSAEGRLQQLQEDLAACERVLQQGEQALGADSADHAARSARLAELQAEASKAAASRARLDERAMRQRDALQRARQRLDELDHAESEARADGESQIEGVSEARDECQRLDQAFRSASDALPELRAAAVQAEQDRSRRAAATDEAMRLRQDAVAEEARRRQRLSAAREAHERAVAALRAHEAKLEAKSAQRAELAASLAQTSAPDGSDDERERLTVLEAALDTARAEAAAAQTAADASAAQHDQLTGAHDTLLRERDALHQSAREAEHATKALQDRAATAAQKTAWLNDQLARLKLRADGLHARLHALGAASAGSGLRTAEQAQAQAAEQLERTARALDAAQTASASAQQAYDEAARRQTELAAELKALSALDRELDIAEPLAERLHVPTQWQRAVAAALGEQLFAGLDPHEAVYWQELAPLPATPAWPEGVQALSTLLDAPTALQRRLAFIGLLADARDGGALQARLQPGQCLVSADGQLWRWDGFVRAAGRLDRAGERLLQTQRRRSLSDDLHKLEDRLRTLGAQLEQDRASERDARAAHEAAQRAKRQSDADLHTAQQAQAAAADERIGLEAELHRLAQERDGFASELAQGEGELDGIRQAQAAQERSAATRASKLAELQAQAERVAAELDDARTRAAADAAAVRDRQDAVAQAQAALTSAAKERDARQRQIEAARAVAAERSRMIAALDDDIAALSAGLGALQDQAQAARGALEQVQAAYERARLDAGRADMDLSEARRALDEASHRLSQAQGAVRTTEERLASTERELAGWRNRLSQALARGDALSERVTRIRSERASLSDELRQLEAGERDLSAELDSAAARAAELGQIAEQAQQDLIEAERRRTQAQSAHQEAREQRVRLLEQLETARQTREEAAAQIKERFGALLQAEFTALLAMDDRAADLSIAELEGRLAELNRARERLGAVNLRAEAEARALQAGVDDMTTERDDLVAAIAKLKRSIQSINREGRERLQAAYEEIDGHFRKLFTRLFGGGKARLVLGNLDDPLNATLDLEASPPGKRLQSLTLLSGGEKALTALALTFALFLCKPAPLCVLDEVDAPLDDANVLRLVDLMQEICKTTGTRFLVVTHHPLTMARMSRLYGVTMFDRGLSKLVSVDLEEAVTLRESA